MDILLNELSLSGQFGSVGDFIGRGLTPLLAVLSEMDKSKDTIYKKQDFWMCKLTKSDTLHDVLASKLLRVNDELRKSKSLLVTLITEPFWEDTRIHKSPNKYEYNGKNIFDTSLAESCERDKVIISFIHKDFSSPTLSISKNRSIININNLFDKLHYSEIAYQRGQISKCEYFEREFKVGKIILLENECRFVKTKKVYRPNKKSKEGIPIYKEIKTTEGANIERYWYLDKFHDQHEKTSHYEVFNNTGNHIGIADSQGNIDITKKVAGRTITI